MIFSPPQFSSLRTKLRQKYKRDLSSTTTRFSKIPGRLARWIKDHKYELTEFSPLKWYFLKQLQFYLHVHSLLPGLSRDPDVFTDYDDEVFEKWNLSEFTDIFLKALNQGKSMAKASEVAMGHCEQHLLTLGARYVLWEDANHPSYRIQTSLGEYKKGRSLGRLLETTLHLEGKELKIMTVNLKEMKHFSQRIEIALKVIKQHSFDSWERFRAFTEVIVPIKQTEFVSYSHQELPGHSMINMYNRDFVDLMDDLLHENGHHHLNYYLNLGKVIEEPQDCIYFSPWRRTLRPLRGIFHAYFTFFWAFELFSSLASAKDMDTADYVFGPKERSKIFWRAVEEYWMLDYTYHDLQRARRQCLISDLGWSFVQEQRKKLMRHKKKVALWEKNLRDHRGQLKELKKWLKGARAQNALG